MVHIDGDALQLQNCTCYSPVRAESRCLVKVAPMEGKPLILRDYQQLAIQAVLDRRRCICRLDMGMGKTLICVGLYRRMHFAQRSTEHCLEPGEIFLVICPANLIDDRWAMEARTHGNPEGVVHVVRGVKDVPPLDANFVIVSVQMLASLLIKHFDEDVGLLWQRRIKAVTVDEVHRLRGDGSWCHEVERLCRLSTFSLGLTGTILANHTVDTAHICKALCLHPDVCTESFWSQPQCLQKAADKPYLAIFDHRVARESRCRGEVSTRLYTLTNHVSGTACFRSFAECLSDKSSQTDSQTLREIYQDIYRSLEEQTKSTTLDKMYLTPGPKVLAFLGAVEDLFARGRYKIFVTVHYKAEIYLLQLFLARLLEPKTPGLRVSTYWGVNDASKNDQVLKEYLARPCSCATKSILLMSVSMATGLNVVNAEKSPMAHVEFSQPFLRLDRKQAQARVDRPGNPYAMTVVVLAGDYTQPSKALAKHRMQADRHILAGDEMADDEGSARQTEDVDGGAGSPKTKRSRSVEL